MAVNLTALKTEITTDPTGLGYPGQQDHACADIINLVRAAIPIDRTTIPAWEIIEATVPSEWVALSTQEKDRYAVLTGAGTINPKGPNTRAVFLAMFGPATTTRDNLAALQTRQGSRAEQLFGDGTVVTHLEIAAARLV